MKYVTTSADLISEDYDSDSGRVCRSPAEDDDLVPVVPSQAGKWRLVAATCSNRRIFWFWESKS